MKRIAVSMIMMLSLSFFNAVFSQVAIRKFILPSHPVKTIQLPEVKLQYVEQGDPNGIPVIFLHGVTDSWHSFESVLPHLPKNIHAFAISQRGHGDSERPAEGYRMRDFANDVAAFIKKKNLGPTVIVGHSMGGVVAQQFAIHHPTLLKGLVIIDSDVSFKNNPGFPEFFLDVMKIQGSIDKKFMDDFQKATLNKPIDPDYFEVLVMEGTKVPPRVFQAAMLGIMELDLTDELKKIKAPTMIFWGDKDAFCLRKGQDVMAKNIKNSRLVIYEDTGHALHWEHPERFSKDLSKFVQEIAKK